MGYVYAEIELINGDDLGAVRRKTMDVDEVKRMFVTALADTGSYMMAINENIQSILQIPVVERKHAFLANGDSVECDVVAPVEVRFKGKRASCSALVLPGDSEVLLGAIPMEEMNVIIHPQRQELIENPKLMRI